MDGQSGRDTAGQVSESQVEDARRALAILRIHAAQLKELEKTRSELARRALNQMRKLTDARSDDSEWPALDAASRILIALNSGLQDRALSGLPEDIRQQVTERLFSFQVLPHHNAGSIQQLLRSVSSRVWALALVGADTAIQECVTSNMSRRAAQMLMEDVGAVEHQEGITTRDVQDARREISMEFYRLYAKGELGEARRG